MSPQEDDFSHYFNAVGRLRSENEALLKRLYDAEAERDTMRAELNRTWEMYVGAATAQGEAEHREDIAQARITALETGLGEALRYDLGWRERAHALLSPAPTDAAHKEETP